MKKTINLTFAHGIILLLSGILFTSSFALKAQSCNASFTYAVGGSANKTVSFTSASNDTLVQHEWYFGDGTTSALINPVKTYLNYGTKTIIHLVKKGNICADTFVTTITLNNSTPCVADFIDNIVGNYVYFNNRSTGNNLSYYWNFGDGTSSTLQNPIKVYNKTDTFLVCLTVRNMFDTTCFNTKCSTIVSGVANTPCVAYFIDTTEIDTNVEIFYFNNQSTGNNLSYYWDFGDSTTSTIEYPIHRYSKSGFYLVCLTIFSNSPDSCTHTYCDSILINSGTNIKNLEVVTLSAIYPIPANDEINLDLNSLYNQEAILSIIDMTGKVCINKVYKTAIGQNNIKLDISELFAGVYIIQINTPQGKIIHKMIK
jgi:PKD repeat protein